MSLARTPEDWHRSTTWIDQEGADVARYVASLKPYERPAYDLKAKLDEWHELGVVTFENIVDHALIERFSCDVEHILANHQKYRIPIDGSHDVAQNGRGAAPPPR